MNNQFKKKICIITTVHPANDTRIYFKEILSLVNAGYFVDYIVKESPYCYSHPNINYIFLYEGNGLYMRLKNLFRALRIAVKLNDAIYHFHDPELIPVGLLLKLFLRKKIIYDIHEIHYDEIKYKPYLPKAVAIMVSYIFFLIERFAMKFFDKNILAEEKYMDYFSGEKSVVVQNFIPEKYVLNGYTVKKTTFEELQLVYLGSITRVRGIHEMLNFAKILASEIKFTFHLIGPFHPSDLEHQVRDFISANNLAQYFRIYGRMSFPEAQEIVKTCDIGLIFLHPIINNITILPTKLFEYMGNGLAVVMSDFPLWKQFNDKHNCGIVLDIFNLELEMDKVLRFLSDAEKIEEIKKNNIRTVRENYVWEVEEKKLLSVYSELEE